MSKDLRGILEKLQSQIHCRYSSTSKTNEEIEQQFLDQAQADILKLVPSEEIYDKLDFTIYRRFEMHNKFMSDDDIRELSRTIHALIIKKLTGEK